MENQNNSLASMPGFLILAEKIAEEAFEGMTDKAGQPYINHVKRVAAKVTTDQEKVIAFLHDVLEDCPQWSLCKLANAFNWEIANTVDLLTHKENLSYEQYINRITASPIAMKVKLADLEDNMNLERITEVKESDLIRTQKYKRAYEYLKQFYYE